MRFLGQRVGKLASHSDLPRTGAEPIFCEWTLGLTLCSKSTDEET
jgi:hypothetical protein